MIIVFHHDEYDDQDNNHDQYHDDKDDAWLWLSVAAGALHCKECGEKAALLSLSFS